MRVAFVAPEDLPIPPIRGGSVQIYLQALIGQLQTDARVDTILMSPGHRARRQVSSQLSTRHVHYRIEFTDQKTYQAQVLDLLKRLAPDVIQVENRPKFALQLKKSLQRPVILNLHSTTFLGPRHIDKRRVRPGFRQLEGVVLNSHFLQKAVATAFHLGARDWKPVVIHPGIDLGRFPYRQRVCSRFSADRPMQVLFVGRVIAQKGVHVLVNAVRKLKQAGYPVRLTVVGRTPPWEQDYQRRVKRLARGYPVHFVGFVAPRDLAKVYARHQVFVCTSQAKEAFGLVNLEAMASGLPVIASSVGGIPEVIGDAGVLIRRPFDADAFRRALMHCLEHPEALAAMSERAKRRAEMFTWDNTAHAFQTLYERV